MEQMPLFDELRDRAKHPCYWFQGHEPNKLISIPPGQPVFHEGAKRDFVYEVISGTLKSWMVTEEGQQLIFGFPHAGDILGLAGLETYPNSVESVSAVSLLPISLAGFQKEISQNSQTLEKLLGWIDQQATQMRSHVAILSMRQPASRAAIFLLEVAKFQSVNSGKDTTDICLPMTQRDISTYLAMAPETFSRIIRKFREMGIVRTGDSHQNGRLVEISDPQRMMEIANGKKI